MKITAEPKSDQINAEDLVGGPRTVTVAGVKTGTAEQKYDVQLEGEPRVWRPPLTVLRTLMKCWGDEADNWIGKRATLYCDDSVTFGRDTVGGIRVSHVSGIDKPMTASVTATRGTRRQVTVQPLPDAPRPQQAAPDSITDQTWSEIQSAAGAQGIEHVGQWAVEQLGRPLNGPGDITAAEGDRLLRLLTTGETEEASDA